MPSSNLVAAGIEQARLDDTAIGVALIDIDNFRLLNENYGHEAGDEAILTVVEALRGGLSADVAFGRYGPDELLLVAPAGSVGSMISVLEDLRTALVDHALQFGASERLPLTVSAGVCILPGPCRFGHGPPDGHGRHAPGGEGQRRRRDPGRRAD